MKFEGYEIIEERDIKDLKSHGILLKHIKSGARVQLLSNDEENKVFYIGFRTPPKDSTGVAHIIEHTVLCGSEKYPLKDPFIELAKGSLNTFLNAMTYPDKTVYPIASCNDQDFKNLMDVYLDAVFHPNIYKTDKIFKQEGWHYEMENEDSDLTINGVVYNEMKGAFSAPDDVLEREVLNSLFPDNTYAIESGGDPDVIPSLTYENYINFHKTYYHPSNSYIYLYGNMDMEERLAYLDKEYLSKYDAIEVNSGIVPQTPFDEVKRITKEYSIMENEEEKENTYLTYNVVIDNNLDKKQYIAFEVLDYALCSAPGAPVKKALIDKKIGKDVYSSYDNGVFQPYFSITAKSANTSDEEEFVSTIENVMSDVCKKGFDKKALMAGLNHLEFKFRESDFGSYPKGLILGLNSFDSWLYDDKNPWLHLEADETFKELRKAIETDYYEKLVSEKLLNNNHKTILKMVPVKGLTNKKDKELKDSLEQYKEKLSADEIKAIIEETKALREYQEEPDTPEQIATLPMLKLEDMKKTVAPVLNSEHKVGDTIVLHHPVFTSGITYLRLFFDVKKVSKELVPYLGLFKNVLGLMDTKNYSYSELYNEINCVSGGMNYHITYFNPVDETKDYKMCLELKVKALTEEREKAIALVKEILFETDFSDTKRMAEIIDEIISRMEESMVSAGHSTAAIRAVSYFSETAAMSEMYSGVTGHQMLVKEREKLDNNESKLPELFEQIRKEVLLKDNLMVDVTCDEAEYEGIENIVSDLKKDLFEADNSSKELFKIVPTNKKEGLSSAAQVQFVALAGNFKKKGLEYTGALRALKVILGYDYLWMNIRVKGGAYGCMSSFGRNGESFLVSYRDPHLNNTIDVFKKAPEYIANFEADERTLTQYIIGAVGDMDVPMTPRDKGEYSLNSYMTGRTQSMIQKEKDELLATKLETIRGLAPYLSAIADSDNLCVVGNEAKLNDNKELFKEVKPIFS